MAREKSLPYQLAPARVRTAQPKIGTHLKVWVGILKEHRPTRTLVLQWAASCMRLNIGSTEIQIGIESGRGAKVRGMARSTQLPSRMLNEYAQRFRLPLL